MEQVASSFNTFVIDPSQHPQDKLYQLITWLWTLAVLILGFFCYWNNTKLGMAIAALLLLAIVPLLFFKRLQTDIVEVHEFDLVVRRINPSTEALRVPRASRIEISFEKVGTTRGKTRTPESVWSLNLWDHEQGYPRRTIVALRVAKEPKEKLFHDLVTFLKQNGIDVTTYNETSIINDTSSASKKL